MALERVAQGLRDDRLLVAVYDEQELAVARPALDDGERLARQRHDVVALALHAPRRHGPQSAAVDLAALRLALLDRAADGEHGEGETQILRRRLRAGQLGVERWGVDVGNVGVMRDRLDAARMRQGPIEMLFPPLAIPSFFEIKESDGVRMLSEKNRISFFRSLRCLQT